MRVADTEVAIRAMEPGDRNFVLATWMRSAKDLCKLPKDRFFRLARPPIEADVDNGIVAIACDQAVPGTIYGWCCYRDGALRWAYVAYELRGNGLLKFMQESYEAAEAAAVAA